MSTNVPSAAELAAAPRWGKCAPPVPPERLPRHVAIIMDGNGRWATQQGRIRINGHEKGAESVRSVTRYAGQVGLEVLTLYAFSTENWKRPQAEIRFLFRLLKKYLAHERAELMANGVRLKAIGNVAGLPEDVQAELRASEDATASGKGLTLCLALNYGGQDELAMAAARLADARAQVPGGTATDVGNALYTAGLPPVDLMVRTAGERRISNFLLWQSMGAEYVSIDICWPEFRDTHLEDAIRAYAARRGQSA